MQQRANGAHRNTAAHNPRVCVVIDQEARDCKPKSCPGNTDHEKDDDNSNMGIATGEEVCTSKSTVLYQASRRLGTLIQEC